MSGATATLNKSKRNSQIKEIWRRYKKSKIAMLGLVLLIFVLAIAIFADIIVPYEEAITQDPANRLQGPSGEHWFGTDELGRDVFARVVHGSRYSLWIGVSTSIFSLIIGGLLGAVAGYYGKTIDNVIMRLTDRSSNSAVAGRSRGSRRKSDQPADCDYRVLYTEHGTYGSLHRTYSYRQRLYRSGQILRKFGYARNPSLRYS